MSGENESQAVRQRSSLDDVREIVYGAVNDPIDPISVLKPNAGSFLRRRTLAKRHSIGELLTFDRTFMVDIESATAHILKHEATQGTYQVTIDDTGPKHMVLPSYRSSICKNHTIRGNYMVSNLLQHMAVHCMSQDGTSSPMTCYRSPRGIDSKSISAFTRSSPSKKLVVTEMQLLENPVDKLLRAIRERYTPALIRRLDRYGIKALCADTKVSQKSSEVDDVINIYVPQSDSLAYQYYQAVSQFMPRVKVHKLPPISQIDSSYVFSMRKNPGILSLALQYVHPPNETESYCIGELRGAPFMVPGGRFNEMYGWDSFFAVIGLLADDPAIDPGGSISPVNVLEICKGIADNMVYQIKHYGRILNANRSYYLLRSQPPFLTDLALRISAYAASIRDVQGENMQTALLIDDLWLESVMEASILEYRNVWMSGPRVRHVSRTDLSKSSPGGHIELLDKKKALDDKNYDSGFIVNEEQNVDEHAFYSLSCYGGEGQGIPIETEASHFDSILSPHAKALGMSIAEFTEKYNDFSIRNATLDEYFRHDRAVRESGHDTTYRLDGRAADIATIDLQSCLYKYESDIAAYLETRAEPLYVGDMTEPESAEAWRKAALDRKETVDTLLWDEASGMYYDWDLSSGKRSIYESATTFWPLWAGMASESQAQRLMEKNGILERLEVGGGLLSGTLKSAIETGPCSLDRPNRQWDYPCGWAPHQMLAWEGLERYGYFGQARRLAYRWAFMICRACYDYNGVVPEKFDVVRMSHKVSAEYGNVGTGFKLAPREGFGWMNASFLTAYCRLERLERRALRALVSPDSLSFVV